MYDDFLLFNYVPDALLISQSQFNSWSSPQKRVSVVQAELPTLKLIPRASDVVVQDSNADTVSTIAEPPAFAENKQGLVPETRIGPPLSYVRS
jgi:hypothetical protein